MYVYVHTYVYIHLYVYVCKCIHVRVCVCIYKCIYVCLAREPREWSYICTYICIHTSVCICIYKCVYVCLAREPREWSFFMSSLESFMHFNNFYLFGCIESQLWRAGSCVAEHGLSSYSTRAQLSHAMWDLSSVTRNQTCVPYIGRWILIHWTTREVPVFCIFNTVSPLFTIRVSSIPRLNSSLICVQRSQARCPPHTMGHIVLLLIWLPHILGLK